MSRATAVKKKSAGKAVKATAKKSAVRTAAPKAHKPANNNKPVAKVGKAALGSAKPAPKPVARQATKSVVPKPAPSSAAPRSEERYAGLTESDLLRAPASQYMNTGQYAFFRERLLAMQRELLEKADLTSEHLREHDIEPDPTDQATIEEEYALELRARDRERKLLKKIEQSLRRIEDGSYGYCEETGEAIGIPRLLARPTATLTIEAQARRELKQKLYGN